MITAEQLIRGFQIALDEGWGYIYGMSHDMWSQIKQRAYVNSYSGDPDRENSCKYGGKWDGHWVTDCSGLFHYVGGQHGLSIPHGSNSIWDKACTAKGELIRGVRQDGQPLKPGTAVFTTSSGYRHNHIGLFVGNGIVIEARGAQYGVVKGSIKDKKWTHWGELKGVIYRQKGEEKMERAKVVLPAGAKGNTVNLRDGESQNANVIKRVPVGATVYVQDDQGTWCEVEYQGTFGWMMSNYLEYDGQAGEADGEGDLLTFAERQKIDDALAQIDAQLEIIRSTLGRG